ncbi:XRE family transcriptional regulator [Acinetobacter bereziniae]|uniref:XRE family transcriptional regulator n=1 Tax=Acinetobacter bereziniae TaxID=106648 RepID=UPI0021E49DB1|nr:XRE family transcriptional regulator [Acinetobacter bereziniae]MCV2445529.1 helix-turn-helix domain-containing protein [Acinetobacter bereziniae]
MHSEFATRLKFFRSLRDLSQMELAKLVGISNKQISDYEVGSSKPRQSTYMKILNALEISDEVFRESDLCSFDLKDLEDDQVVTFKNSNGEKIILPRSYCKNNKLFPVSDLSVFQVKGNTMSPTFLDGDMVLVDVTDRYLSSGSVYLIHVYGEKMVARLNRKEDGVIEIVKDISTFYTKSVKEDAIIILGRIVFRQGLV